MGREKASRSGRLLFVVGVLLWSLFALAQDANVQRAEQLMKEGKAAEAFALLDPLEDKLAGDVEYDYQLGISALDSGKADRATIAFERVLAVNPNFAGARLDLARAYFQLGDLQRAKTEFETVLSQDPPEGARQVVVKYLDTIATVEAAKRRQVRTYLEATVGRDTNVNNSTSQSQIGVPALGNVVFTLNPTNVKRPDSFKSVGAGVDYFEQVRPKVALYAGADYRQRMNFTQDIFDNDNLDVRGGVAIGESANQLRLGATSGRYELDHRLSRKAQGFNGEWKVQINPANQFNLFSQNTSTRFTDAAVRVNSFDQTTSGLGWLHILSDGKAVVFGNYFVGKERDTDGRPDGGKGFEGVRIGGQYMLREGLDLFAVASAQSGSYARENATFLAQRKDDQSDLILGATWRFAKDWSLRPQFLHTRNSSNITIYRFERSEFSLTVRRDFN